MSFPSKNSTVPSSLVPTNIKISAGLEDEDLSFRQAIRVVRKRKHIIYWTVFVCGALALAVSFVLRPYYSSTGTIEIEKQQNDAMDSALGALASSLGGEDDVKTEIQTEVSVLQSDALGIETMERMKFEEHQRQGWHLFGKHERIPQERGLPLRDAPVAREQLLKKFENSLTITPVTSTRLIQISFEDPDPKYAAGVVNALIDQYVQDRLARRNSSTVQASQWMSDEITGLNKQVQAAQQRLIDYQRQSGLIVIPSAGGGGGSAQPGGVSAGGGATVTSPVLDRLTQLNQNLVTARSARIMREAIYRLAQAGDVNGLVNMAEEAQTSAPGGGIQSGMFSGLEALRQQQVTLRLQLSSALETYGPKNPHLVDLDDQLAEIDRQLKDEVKRIVARTEMDYKVALNTEAGIQAAYDAEQKEAYKINDSQIRLAILQQEADSERALYQDLYTKLQESKLSEGTQSSNVSIISAALSPAKPLHPKKVLNTAVGIGVGLFLGVIAAFILNNLDDSIGTSLEVESLTALPVLGSIVQFESSSGPLTRKNQNSLSTPGAQVGGWLTSDPKSQASEAYRALRTTLLLSQPGSAPRTLLLTSSLSSEGKTTTTYNLAVSFAMLGRRVLALDADLRKPSLHRHVRNSNLHGLSNVLTSSLDPSEVIVDDPNVPNLSILTSGPIPPNPAELLGSAAFSETLETLSKRYDLLLIDSPPAMLVADSFIMSSKVDGVVVIVRSGSTTRPALSRVTENLRRNNANLLGFVLNAVNSKSAEYYYTYGYYGQSYEKEYANAKS